MALQQADDPVLQKITVKVCYIISFKPITEEKEVTSNATVGDLVNETLQIPSFYDDDDDYEVYQEYDDSDGDIYSVFYGEIEVRTSELVSKIGQSQIYFIRSRVAEFSDLSVHFKIRVMKHFTSNPTKKGNLLENSKKRSALNFLMPICDHREGRVGDDVTLYYPGFQKFINNVGKMKPDLADVLLVHEICKEMSQIFDNESNRVNKFAELLKKLLEWENSPGILEKFVADEFSCIFGFDIRKSTNGKSMADLAFSTRQYIQVEVKKEMCGSKIDSYSQVIAYYIQSLSKDNNLKLETDFSKLQLPKQVDLCSAPAYLIELVGPHLFISGAVFGKYVFVDRLVDPVWLVPHQNEEAMIRIAKIFKALKCAIEEIRQYYHPYNRFDLDQPRFPVFMSFNEGKCRIKYQERIKRHVFKGRLECDGEEHVDVIIKFTKRYCHEAHDLMYRKGFAPQLIHCHEVEGTQYTAVVVEYIKNAKPLNKLFLKHHLEQYSDPGKKEEALQSLKHYCKGLLKTMHKDLEFCHGKIKSSSIIVQRRDYQLYIFLVNYQWAGKIKEASYPPFLHVADIQDGIEPEGLITPEQDEAQFDKIFEQAHSLK